ncbi:oligopeptide transport system permease protein OppC [Ruminiclostridium hungatei]|uniref:Oligopeptide transport system permease protein OppC n=1 Tax=Ruminiclostridium hungatei TaxID=48256 RepID=A0A1V4SPI4_RUMHU|nr:ABC transporter permease [Ruminiclostridium hungatei]OPX45760.1 oligopeptide transport system permease protein OppC [Ruminiclostridium hungatei]
MRDTNNTEVLDSRLFLPATESEKTTAEIMRPSVGYWKDAWKRLRANKVAMGSLIVILLVFLAAIIGPMLSPYAYDQINKGSENLSPNAQHLFGTDSLGRDLFTRTMIGARISLAVGIVAALMISVIGILYGAISGFIGGWVDIVLMRIVDIVYSVPTILIVILLQVVLREPLVKFVESGHAPEFISKLGVGLISIFFVLALLYWVDMARIVRGQILALKEQEYVLAAKVLGSSNKNIILKHLIPNCIGQIIVVTTLKIPEAIFVESFLSFIGLGVSIPMASLGSLSQVALKGIYSYPYMLIFPAATISIIILSMNLFGDGLRDALDPRMKK